MVRFYDATYVWKFGGYGQQCASYYAKTLTGDDGFGSGNVGETGLNLDMGVDVWSVDAHAMQKVLDAIGKHMGSKDEGYDGNDPKLSFTRM